MNGRCAACVALVVATSPALADGGVPIDSRFIGDARWTLLMRPGRASVGPASFTLLAQHPGSVQIEVQGEGFRSGCVLREEAGRPGLHGTLELEQAGPCRVRLIADDHGSPVMDVSLDVSPADPVWWARLPWALSWVPLLAVVAASRWRFSRRLH